MTSAEKFAKDGYADPAIVFSPDECRDIMAAIRSEPKKPIVWMKGWAANCPSYYRPAADPRVVDLVRPTLGDDIILWGASLVIRRENMVHVFHTDVESRATDGGFATVWIGLENTTRESGLKFIPGSHLYGRTVQEMNRERGVKRANTSDETTLDAAKTFGPDAHIVQPEVNNGVALPFDGRIWHGSHNASHSTRTAILLQYARADRPVHVPDTYDWPFTARANVRPPVIVVSGTAPKGVNRVVEPPRS